MAEEIVRWKRGLSAVQTLCMKVRGPDLSKAVARDNIWCYNCDNIGHIAKVYQEEYDQKADQLALLWVWLDNT